MSGFQVSDRTVEAQRGASDPSSSVFVAANAGSGKTHVLTERVVRLLLAKAPPSKILCLTYTKAAAAEMANRVFKRLSTWATAPRATLEEELKRLTGRKPDDADIADARKLFAEALETPGGLKIQTIHAFCEAILHQFPLEANVPGHFEVMDGTTTALLLAEARRLLITGSGGESRPREERAALAEAFAAALSVGGEFGLDQLIGEIVSKRDAIRRHVTEAGGLEPAVALLRRALGLADGETAETILSGVSPVPGFDDDFRENLAPLAAASSKATDQKLVQRLAAIDAAEAPGALLEALKTLCLTQKGEPFKPGSVATKAVADVFPDFAERLETLVGHIMDIEDRMTTLRLAEASAAALVIADRLEEDYASLKRRRGKLDFEDLIVRTADLLSRSSAADWVHYKLDQGIDHVLIDEAQDTSPRQWQVMRSLVEEFFTGAAARNVVRTVFAVGDEKQSIYSFQGASPAMFSAERRRLGQRAGEARQAFAELRLHQSFRSARDVLDAVDRVFSDPANRQGLSFDDVAPTHESARGGEPGLVEVWPVVQALPRAEPEDWLTPLDVEPEASPANRLARRIASQIGAWIGDAITVKGETRAITAGDVLILVRKRSSFVEAMGKALRDQKIPVAGADRLVITDHIAVQDLMALGRTVANVEDELSLAAVLKSPLFDFSDDDLMALALSREGGEPLYLALRRLAGPEGLALLPDFVADAEAAGLIARAQFAFTRLEALRDRAGFESVFAFYARLLGPEGGRAKLAARLGRDSGEVIDAFLDLALAEEEAGQPGLDAFLADLAAAPPEIKREMEHGKEEVRIMTVHASKGLEAPVVFLVDPGSAPFSHAHGARLMAWHGMPGLAPDQAPGFLWRADKSLENGAVAALKEEEKRLAGEEYRRLLYVGMTRAADRLVVCGTSGTRGPHEESWLQRVEAALRPDAVELTDAEGAVLGWRTGTPGSGQRAGARPAAEAAALATIDLSALPPEVLAPRPLSPSSAGEAHRIETEDGPAAEMPPGAAAYVSPVLAGAGSPSFAIRRGLAIHRLLQVLPDLPPDERAESAERYLASAAADMPPSARAQALDSVLAVLGDAAFAPIFAEGSRAEVAVTGLLTLGGRAFSVTGTIDRLAVSADAVRIVDFKTNRPPPENLDAVPPAYVLQLALYRALLQPLYPDRAVRAGLLFTESPVLIDIPPAVMDDALARRANVAENRTPRPPNPTPA
jgi:ATP-dependent helicase/nuclease subunit A